MSDTYNYPVEVERDEDGRYVVAFPDFGWGATDGATLDEALAEARDLLRELIAATMRAGEDLPQAIACDQAAAPRGPAGADRIEGSPLRSVPQGWHVATPSRPRSRHCRERDAAHAESRPCHQGRQRSTAPCAGWASVSV